MAGTGGRAGGSGIMSTRQSEGEKAAAFMAALLFGDEMRDEAVAARAEYLAALALWDNAKDAADEARLEARAAFDRAEAARNQARAMRRPVRTPRYKASRRGEA